MHERFELRRHHEVHEEDREDQHETQRVERLRPSPRSGPERNAVVPTGNCDLVDDALQRRHGRAEVAVGEVGRDHRDALLADAAHFGRADGQFDARRRRSSGTGQSLPGFTIRLRTSSIEAARASTLRTSTSICLSRSL